MVRSIRRFVPVCLGIVVAVVWLTQAAEAKEPNPIVLLAKKMSQPVDYPGLDDPTATLSDALDMMAKKYNLSFDIRVQAFEMDQLKDVERTPIAQPAIPKMTHVRLAKVLEKILHRIPAASGAVYVLRRDHIEITTGLQKMAEFYPHEGIVDPVTGQPINPLDDDLAGTLRRLLPLVHFEFDKRPLREALQELAEATDWTVVLNEQAAEKAKPVTATLVNVPLNTAVELLAEMSDLTVVRRNKSLYLTTKEKAAAMAKTRLEMLGNQAGMGFGGGVAGFGGIQGQAGTGIGGGQIGFGGIQGGAGFQGNFQGMAANGGIRGGNPLQPSRQTSPPPAPKPPAVPAAANAAPSDLAKMQAEIAKLQVEIAKLQEELARLQLKKGDPQNKKKDGREPKGTTQRDPAHRGHRSEITKPRNRLARK